MSGSSSSKSIKQPNITLITSLPEGSKNLYNIMNQCDQYVTIDNIGYIQTGKKRCRPSDINNISRNIKKPRYN